MCIKYFKGVWTLRDTSLFSNWRTFIPRLIPLGAGVFSSHFQRYKHLFIKYKFQKTCWHCPVTFTKAFTMLKTNKSFCTGDYEHSRERAKLGKLANCVLCCWGDLLGKASFKLRAFVGVFSAVQICVCCVPPIQCQQARPGQTALGTSGLRDPHGKARKG